MLSRIQVDNYEAKEYHFDIKDSADAQFNNIQYMYIGKNESMNDGFIGCVSRVEFDDIYPLKLLFQESGPPNVRSIGSKFLPYSSLSSVDRFLYTRKFKYIYLNL